MNETQAIDILDRASAAAAGSRQDHQAITQAVEVIRAFIADKVAASKEA